MTKEWLEELMHEKLLLIPTNKAQEAINIIFDKYKVLEKEKRILKAEILLALIDLDIVISQQRILPLKIDLSDLEKPFNRLKKTIEVEK